MSTRPAILAHHFDTLQQQRESQAVGMWLFLATELLVFGAMFTGYTTYRALYPAAFEAASQRLNLLIGGINTVVLLSSSLTMALSVYAARTGKPRMLLVGLVLTILLGSLFMGLKVVEYYLDYREQLVPNLAFDPQQWTALQVNFRQVQLFLVFYYIMTGLHAVHLTVGIGVLTVQAVLAAKGRFPPENYMPIELAGLYWHFVDIVWIFLLPLLYLVGTRTTLY